MSERLCGHFEYQYKVLLRVVWNHHPMEALANKEANVTLVAVPSVTPRPKPQPEPKAAPTHTGPYSRRPTRHSFAF